MNTINQSVCTAAYRSPTHFNKWHNMQYKGWRLVDDELVDTGYSMAANNRTRVTEKLNKLGDENVEWTIEGIRVQLITAVLTDLMKSTERTLQHQNNTSSPPLTNRLKHHTSNSIHKHIYTHQFSHPHSHTHSLSLTLHIQRSIGPPTSQASCSVLSISVHRVGSSSGHLISCPQRAMVDTRVPAVARMMGDESVTTLRLSCFTNTLVSSGNLS